MTEPHLQRQGPRFLLYLAFAALVVLLLSSLYFWTEMRYAMGGRTALATVVDIKGARNAGPFALMITYTFHDADEGVRTESHVFESCPLRQPHRQWRTAAITAWRSKQG